MRKVPRTESGGVVLRVLPGSQVVPSDTPPRATLPWSCQGAFSAHCEAGVGGGLPGCFEENLHKTEQGQQKRVQAEQQKPLWSLSSEARTVQPHKKSSQRTYENAG